VLAAELDRFPRALRDEFLRLRLNFEAGLETRWREINQCESLSEQAMALHRLAGASASYGRTDLSLLAREAELLATSASTDRLNAVLLRLAHAIGSTPGSHPGLHNQDTNT
jgi:HPt (histidine-containing phosphotransfer) domain-containing protein